MFADRFTHIHALASQLAHLAVIAVFAMVVTTEAHTERAENAVTRWNTIALDAFAPTEGTNPMMQSRTFAILHAAIHDAVNSIDRRFEFYTRRLAARPGASVDAAVATAARDVLVTLLPERAAFVGAAYDQALATIPDGPAKKLGIEAGRAAAHATLIHREGDGHEAAAQPAYVPQSGPGKYQFTAPFTFAAQPGWGHVRPFVVKLAQHSVHGPQPLSSAEYARDLEHLKAIGSSASTTRTPAQTEIARFWYEDSPLGWNRITSTVVRQRGLDTWSAARAFALVNFAMADGFIVGFDAKYRFNFWRPVTAIHETEPSWQPLMTTPPVPDYPSTHTVLGWAAAEVLIAVFGDDVQYTATSLTLPGVTRNYKGFSVAAEENGMSRIYAGIHFQHAVKDGKYQGRSVGRAVAKALPAVR